MPPISTFRSGLRAYCVNWRGAVAWTIERASPRGKRTRTPVTSAPASRNRRRASSLPRNSRPTSWRTVSALYSMSDRPAPTSFRAAVRPGGPLGLGWQRHDRREVREGRRLVREGHGLHEMLLEPRLDRGLDLLDPPDDALDLAPRGARQQRDERPGPRGVPGRLHVREVAVRHEAQDHRVGRVDLAAERPGEADLVHGVDLQLVHQQPDARVERGLGELDGSDIVLGDHDARAAGDPLVQDVPRGAAVGDDARRARGERSVDHAVLGDDAGQEQLRDDLDDPRTADAG